MHSHSRAIAKNAVVVASATMLSRILGLVRDQVTAFALGAGPLADAFFVAFRVPNLLRSLFAEGSLTMAFVPVFSKVRQNEGPERAFAVARAVQFWIILILGVITLLAIIFAEPLTNIIAFGFKSKDPSLIPFTAKLLRLCFPYIMFISGVALCMGILNSMDHFLAPALAPVILNVVLIGFALVAYYGHFNVAVALAVGVLFAGIGQWLLQQPFLWRQGFSWFGAWNPRDPEVVRIGWLMLPTVIGSAVYQFNILFGTLLASFLPFGSVTCLYYADRLVQLPLGVFGVAISTAALPSLASLAAANRMDDFKATLNASLGLTLFVSLPAAAGLIGLSVPVIKVLFEHGAFDSAAVQATAMALIGYSVGLPAFSCARTLVSAYYSRENTRTPVFIACLCLGLNIGLGLLLMQPLKHVGLALAASISSWVNVLLLSLFLSRQIGPWITIGGHLFKMLTLSALLCVCAFATSTHSLLALGLIPVWISLYFIAARAWGLEEARLVFEGLGKLKAKLLGESGANKTNRP